MKELILRTRVGGAVIKCRDKLALIKSAIIKPESIGCLSNDFLSTRLITNICAKSKSFIDVGSHIGSIISEVQRNGDGVRIYGVEAIPNKVVKLRKNYPNVEIFECALSDASGETTFYINNKQSGYSSLLTPKDDGDHITPVSVTLKTLDELSNFTNVDAIKIDVEGAELAVIKGSRNTIANNQPIIMFESGPGEDKELMWNELASLGYGIHLPNRLAHNDIKLTRDGFIDAHTYPRYTTNYFAVPLKRRIEFRDRARLILGI